MESEKHHEARLKNGFYSRFMQGRGLDIGFKSKPVVENATGVELNYPGYDGVILPFPDASQDFVYSSHMLEHVPQENFVRVIQEWHRVTKIGGHIIIIVPHQYLYEKRWNLPSKFNRDHKVFYTPQKLLSHVEWSLAPNSYRVRFLRDNDDGFDYSLTPEKHSRGGYEIELVIEKIKSPEWKLV